MKVLIEGQFSIDKDLFLSVTNDRDRDYKYKKSTP